ncbi:MAG TPA: SurA N-terminal domain-containing protein [Polyangiaceae bacterium]|jgi:peptidyl-prolyl cis-trans isomerase D|nr:SurA N-terminal domain-containing protein [Polyangiaceae bacterium]
MLSFFRQKGLSNVLYGAIILATILTFVIEFRPNASQRTGSLSEQCAARVRGRCLDPKDFSSAYRILMPSRSAQTSRKLNAKRIALDGLVERELLDDEAKRLGITVTEDEVTDQLYSGFVRASVPLADPAVAQSILQEMYQSYARAGLVSQEVAQAHFNDRDPAIPVDFRDPKSKMFDMKVYERAVRNLSNRSTTEFRAEQARELLAAKMRDVIRAPIRVSDAEAWEEYQRRYDTATVSWIPVRESWVTRWIAATASDADVNAWVKDHAKEFDAELDDRTKVDAPKAGHLRHILVKFPYGATDDEKATSLAKLSWAAARIKAGESFAEVARDVSEDSSNVQGGDVGDKTDGFVLPFKAAADALAPGQMTAGAVESQFGYHFIMRDDPAKAAEIAAQVKRGLGRRMFAKATATDASKRVAGQIEAGMHGGQNAEDAIRGALDGVAKPAPGGGGKAAKVERLRVLPAPAGAADAGASAGKGDGGSPAVPAALPEKTFDAGQDGDRPQVQTSSAFNHGGDPFAGLSPEGTTAVIDFAFAGSPPAKEGDVLTEPVRTADAFVVVQLKQHKTATTDEFEKNRDTFVQELLRTKRDEALSLYVRRLRDAAKDDIKVDPSFVQEVKVDGGASSTSDEEDEY